MEETQQYRVLLYYHYVTIDDPETKAAAHLNYCKHIGLKGRVFIASEGINGTVSGTVEQTEKYIRAMRHDEHFAETIFKIDEVEGHVFKKMHVRPKKELVSLRLEDDIDPKEQTGDYLSPKEFYEAMQRENTIVLDARNDYEYDIGHFEGAVRPDIRSFKELPDWIEENKEQFEGKQILTYCTGGIRCEKFSGWLKEEGFENVSQLHGGIVTYGKDEEVKGAGWNGKCYVFDERLSVPVNQHEHVIVGRDHFDDQPCERYVNCGNPECNKQILCSEENEDKYMRGCTHECRVTPRNRYIIKHELSKAEVDERLELIQRENIQHV